MKVIFPMDKRQEKEYIITLMVIHMQGIGIRISFMGMVITYLAMVKDTKDFLIIIYKPVKENIHI